MIAVPDREQAYNADPRVIDLVTPYFVPVEHPPRSACRLADGLREACPLDGGFAVKQGNRYGAAQPPPPVRLKLDFPNGRRWLASYRTTPDVAGSPWLRVSIQVPELLMCSVV